MVLKPPEQSLMQKAFTSSPDVPLSLPKQLDTAEQKAVRELFEVWRTHYRRNILRSAYYNAHQEINDFGISIPDKIKNKVKPMVAWSSKAVRALADLSVFEGIATGDSDTDRQLNAIIEDNELDIQISEAIVSAYTHACSFLTVSRSADGRAHIMPRSAERSAATWDYSTQSINGALTITKTDKNGSITQYVVWLKGKNLICTLGVNGWQVERQSTANENGVDVFPLAYDAHMNRPFGRSRISRTLMQLTDIGVRTMLRMEATAEFYSAPHIWFLGLDPNSMKDMDAWSSLTSAINAVSKDMDGDTPQLQQIAQASMQPHSDMLKTVALLVAAETNLPVNDLGITMDNPASAEAMAAAERKLSREADRQNIRFGRSIKNALIRAAQINGAADLDALRSLQVVWKPTRDISDAARADYYVKVAQANPVFASSDTGLLRAGLSWDEVQALRREERRQQARLIVEQLAQQQEKQQQAQTTATTGTPTPEETEPTPTPNQLPDLDKQ